MKKERIRTRVVLALVLVSTMVAAPTSFAAPAREAGAPVGLRERASLLVDRAWDLLIRLVPEVGFPRGEEGGQVSVSAPDSTTSEGGQNLDPNG